MAKSKHVNFLVYWKPTSIGATVDECKVIGAWSTLSTGKPLTKAEIQTSWERYYDTYKAQWFAEHGRGYVELVQNLDMTRFLCEPSRED